MDRTGIVALIVGLVLCAAGIWAIWIYLPEVIAAVKGLIGLVVLFAGLCLLLFGILVIND